MEVLIPVIAIQEDSGEKENIGQNIDRYEKLKEKIPVVVKGALSAISDEFDGYAGLREKCMY